MTPSEKFSQSVVCGILTRFFILWLLTEIGRDRNNHRQERSTNKREPEENYDDCSSKGNCEVKSIQLCWLFIGKSLFIKILETQVIIHKICEKMCARSQRFFNNPGKKCVFERTSFMPSYYIHITSYGVESFYFLGNFSKTACFIWVL